MKNLKLILTGAILTAFSSCVNGDHYGVIEGECATMTPTVEIVDLNGTATTTPQQWLGEDVLEAYAVSSDEGGNFYKSISMVGYDTAGNEYGFSIPVDQYNLYTEFEPGRKVYINLNELYYAIDDRTDALEIGTLYEGQVGRIAINRYQERIIRSCEKMDEDDLVITGLSINEAQDDQYLNRLIELDGVQFAETSLGFTYFDEDLNSFGGATNHDLTDVEGNTVIVRASEYATFAGDIIPDGSGKVRGVMTKYNDDYQFMIRTLNDVMLDNPRIVGFFSEDFQSATNNTDLDITGWTNFAEQGTRVWREKTFSGNGYTEFSPYGSGDATNIAWLVSPAINLDNTVNELLTFKIAQHHLDVDDPGNSLEVYISTDFDGMNVLTATWNAVPANIPTTATSWYEFIGTSYDISGYNGDIYVAFKFTGSGTNTTLDGAFQIDDVNVYGG